MDCRKCKKQIPNDAVYCPYCASKQAPDKIRKRGNGQGYAYKRGRTWTAVWTTEAYILEDKRYKQVRRTKGGFASKTAALAYAAKPDNGERTRARTLRDYWQTWSNSAMLKLSDGKQTAYEIAWKRLEELAPIPVSDLTVQDLQLCIDNNTNSYYPARDMKTVLSHLYKLACAEGQARAKLSDFITLPSLDEQEMNPFTEDELGLLWQAYGAGDRPVGYALIMIYTGMMPGELQQLNASMIDYDTQQIVGAGLKTKKRKQTPMVFPDLLIPVLMEMTQTSTSKTGMIVDSAEKKFYAQYHRSIVEAGCRDLPPYSCRHTTATALALGNIAPSVIQEVMRHTKFATTQRYIHPDTTASLAAVNTLDAGTEPKNKRESAQADSQDSAS